MAAAVTLGIPTPAFSTALAFYDGYRLEALVVFSFIVVSTLDTQIFTINKVKSTVAHICHGKTYFSTAKRTFPRQNLLFHGKTYFSTTKLTLSRQNLLSHGKTYYSTAKLTFPRQNLLSHGKTYFLTAKLTSGFQSLCVYSSPPLKIREFFIALRSNIAEEEDFV